MRREQLEHVIRAAAAITNQYELVVIGSDPQALVDRLRLLDDLSRVEHLTRWVRARSPESGKA